MTPAQTLGWCWRLIMTGFCFLMFGVGGLLLTLLLSAVLLLRRGARRQWIARHLISGAFRFFLWAAARLGVLEFRLRGAEKLRADRGCLVVANHPTLIDYVMLAAVVPTLDCVVKAEVLSNPFFGGVIRAAGYLVNNRAETFLDDCRARLAQGACILIFPEGTRTRPGQAISLQRGAAQVAVRCPSDVRLVAIHCSEAILAKHSHWYDVPARKPVFTVSVGDRLSPGVLFSDTRPEPSVAARRLTRVLAERLTQGLQGLS
ncbi:lysophospholipid acyltransferase family protein [Castellaniella caeni]|uniref:lysophospholipid acyltransferase family protein n=1 Tax=Castellaniella caeni TaxID=266123 RepID=UPI0008325FE7|nr:lysophospholipid acyltransferase family protein [Castellaniella caeni]